MKTGIIVSCIGLRTRSILWLLFLYAASLSSAAEPIKRTPDEVLVVYNAGSPISKSIALDYIEKRHIKHSLEIKCVDSALKTDYDGPLHSRIHNGGEPLCRIPFCRLGRHCDR